MKPIIRDLEAFVRLQYDVVDICGVSGSRSVVPLLVD